MGLRVTALFRAATTRSKECNEVKSIPYKSRQLDDMGWNETAFTSYAGYDGHRSFKRADDVGAACACEA